MASLQKVLGLPTIVSTSAGLAFAAVNFLALVQVASLMAGAYAWLAILVAGVLCLLAAGVFGALNNALPSAAGIRVWTRQGIGNRFSLFFTLFYLCTVLAVIAADSFILAEAISAGVPVVPGIIWILFFLFATYLANRRGVRVAGRLQDVTTYSLLASLVVIALLALLRHPSHAARTAGLLAGNPFQAVAVAVFVFVGFEWVTPLAEETREPRLIPPGMFLAIGAIAVAFGLFTSAMTHVLSPRSLSHSLVPQLVVGERALGPVGFWWMLLVTSITAITTFNGSFVSASRLLYAMSREKTLPRVFARLNDRFVPENALTFLFLVSVGLALVVYWLKSYAILIDAGAAIEAAMYVVAAYALLGLRRRRPELVTVARNPLARLAPWLTMVVFGLLFLGAVTAPVPPSGRPWTAVLLAALAILSLVYTIWGAPRERRGGTGTLGGRQNG